VLGDGGGTWSFCHVEDAASATVAAVTSEDELRGVFNIVDEEPAPVRDWLPAYARALGAPRPRRVPAALGRLVAGPIPTHLATRAPGASNARAKARLGWSPRFPSWRAGFDQALG
jgi:nucleoside-diphosphate-sugar epimerase